MISIIFEGADMDKKTLKNQNKSSERRDTNYEMIKSIILDAQKLVGDPLGTSPADELMETINGILNDEIKLITASDLSEKLKLPASFFANWGWDKKHSHSKFEKRKLTQATALGVVAEDVQANKSCLRFPDPIIYINNEPRWDIEEIKKWILKGNIKMG